MEKEFNLHLVSDSTGHTIITIARSVMKQISNIRAKEYLWAMVRDENILNNVLNSIEKNPGIVLYIIANDNLRNKLKEFCHKRKIPHIAAIGKIIKDLSYCLNTTVSHIDNKPKIDEEYFDRIEAIDFTLAHDDGQSLYSMEDADVVLIGPSRTSKSPTCFYLAYSGYKAANIPFVLGQNLPDIVFELTNSLIVGLIINPERLMEIRKNRLLTLKNNENDIYIDIELVKKEILEVKKLCIQNNWPIIDVTKKSIEEITAIIIEYLVIKRRKLSDIIFSK